MGSIIVSLVGKGVEFNPGMLAERGYSYYTWSPALTSKVYGYDSHVLPTVSDGDEVLVELTGPRFSWSDTFYRGSCQGQAHRLRYTVFPQAGAPATTVELEVDPRLYDDGEVGI